MAEKKKKTRSAEAAQAPVVEEPDETRQIFTGESFKGAVFEHVDLDGAVFNAGNLYCVAVIGSNFDQTRIEECSMQNAQFRNMGMKNASFQAVNLHGAVFTNADMRESKVMHLDMCGSGFAHLNMNESLFENCAFIGTKFNGCDWNEATIDGIPVRDLIAAYRELHK
ncbi:MAG: pentapeptide repeat-containing protein [Oscillospiraceae bacterium]|nr:pentapeptide repeat-containing protein [Oscillospiraceae bacterium]